MDDLSKLAALCARTDLPNWLTTEQVAEILGLSVSTLEKWRRDEKGPAFKRISRKCVRYDARVVSEWMAQQDAG